MIIKFLSKNLLEFLVGFFLINFFYLQYLIWRSYLRGVNPINQPDNVWCCLRCFGFWLAISGTPRRPRDPQILVVKTTTELFSTEYTCFLSFLAPFAFFFFLFLKNRPFNYSILFFFHAWNSPPTTTPPTRENQGDKYREREKERVMVSSNSSSSGAYSVV